MPAKIVKRSTTDPDGVRPIVLGSFVLTATSVEVHGKPTWTEYQGAFAFAKRSHQASGFWLADLLRYGESRKDWAERLSQAVDATGMSAKTLRNVRAVGAIEPSRRRDDVDFGLHEAVVALPPEDQTHWLDKAAAGGWTVRDLRHAIQRGKRTTVIEGRADQMYDVDVQVSVSVEAQSPHRAESKAWDLVKTAIGAEVDRGVIPKSAAKVIAAHVRPE